MVNGETQRRVKLLEKRKRADVVKDFLAGMQLPLDVLRENKLKFLGLTVTLTLARVVTMIVGAEVIARSCPCTAEFCTKVIPNRNDTSPSKMLRSCMISPPKTPSSLLLGFLTSRRLPQLSEPAK